MEKMVEWADDRRWRFASRAVFAACVAYGAMSGLAELVPRILEAIP